MERLNAYVVSASIENASIQNLNEPVTFTLHHVDQNRMAWVVGIHRGVKWNIQIGIIQSVFVTILPILESCWKVQRDNPSKIPLDLSAALLMLNVVFLTDCWLTSFNQPSLCIALATLLHCFFLAAFMCMCLESVPFYLTLVKVFNVYVPKYILKCYIAGWGVPAIVITLMLIINKDFYGNVSLSESHPYSNFCWIQDNVVFYISLVVYFFLIFLMNTATFITSNVLLQIPSVKTRTQKTSRFWKQGVRQDLKSAFSLMFLLGLTWVFAIFAWGAVRIFFLYLFSIFNTLQGFFIFAFHCLMKDEVVKQCRVHVCWRRFRLSSYSDWSGSGATAGSTPKHLNHGPPSQPLRSLHSNGTSSTFNADLLPRTSPDTNFKIAGVHCNPSAVSPEDDETNHPFLQRVLSMDTGLHYPQKAGFLHRCWICFPLLV